MGVPGLGHGLAQNHLDAFPWGCASKCVIQPWVLPFQPFRTKSGPNIHVFPVTLIHIHPSGVNDLVAIGLGVIDALVNGKSE